MNGILVGRGGRQRDKTIHSTQISILNTIINIYPRANIIVKLGLILLLSITLLLAAVVGFFFLFIANPTKALRYYYYSALLAVAVAGLVFMKRSEEKFEFLYFNR